MDIKSMDEKRFSISRIKKTIIIQIDDNGNGSETTVIDPEMNLILAAIMEFCKKNQTAEQIKINSPQKEVKHHKIERTNGKVNKLLDIKRNNSISSKERNASFNKTSTDMISSNKNTEKQIQHKHRFLSQDTNFAESYSYRTPNQQYFIERKNSKSKNDIKDNEKLSFNDPILESFSSSYATSSAASNKYVNSGGSDANSIEGVLSDEEAPLRKIKKSNFIQRFYDLNK